MNEGRRMMQEMSPQHRDHLSAATASKGASAFRSHSATNCAQGAEEHFLNSLSFQATKSSAQFGLFSSSALQSCVKNIAESSMLFTGTRLPFVEFCV